MCVEFRVFSSLGIKGSQEVEGRQRAPTAVQTDSLLAEVRIAWLICSGVVLYY